MSTFTKVQEIFYSGGHAFRGDRESANEIAFLLDEGYLTLKTISIGEKHAYDKFLDDVIAREHFHNLAAGGGKNHIALKLMAAQYLQERGFNSVQYEHLFCGYYPDVMTEDRRVVVECGHTQNPEKMLMYFRQGGIEECIQIPYPAHDDADVRGYSFTAGAELKGFLDFLEKENAGNLKRLHRQNRNNTTASIPPG